MRLLTSREMATVGGKLTSRWTCSGSPLNSASSHPKSAHTCRVISSMRSRCRAVNTRCRYLVTKTKWACRTLPATEPVAGIDLGLTHFAVLSDGRKIASPRFLRRAEKKLSRAQRSLSRKEKGSRNRAKARVKVARAHARVADARREFHHELSTRLIRDNQAVAVEDLAVKGLARTRMAKSVHDAGWSAFVAILEYKARLYGREFHRIGRFIPTSQTCSACGVKDGPKPLHVRAWQCHGCGTWLDRDVNAAVNVAKAAGLAVTACGAQIRPGPCVPAQRSEAGTHPKSRRQAA